MRKQGLLRACGRRTPYVIRARTVIVPRAAMSSEQRSGFLGPQRRVNVQTVH